MTGSPVLPLMTLADERPTVARRAGLPVLLPGRRTSASCSASRGIGGLEASILVLLLILAFALSTDYGVFLLGRIKEAHDSGLPNREAIALGLERTGRLVTAAALLFCVGDGRARDLSILSIKELGFGAALAVAIDATVVRALLVPSLMGRLGERTGGRRDPAPPARPHRPARARARWETPAGEPAGRGRTGSGIPFRRVSHTDRPAGLGSNLGDRRAHLQAAVARCARRSGRAGLLLGL